MRRLIHAAIVILAIATLRSCGGPFAVEDRMANGARWIAERVGITALQEAWRENVTPVLIDANRAATRHAQDAVAQVLNRAEAVRGGILEAILDGAGAVAGRFGRTVSNAVEASDSSAPANATPSETATSGDTKSESSSD